MNKNVVIVIGIKQSRHILYKATKLLGRASLQSVWSYMEFLPATERQRRLKQTRMISMTVTTMNQPCVPALVWSADGHGRAELALRTADRSAAAIAATEITAAAAAAE